MRTENLGKWVRTPEFRQRMSEMRKGKPISPKWHRTSPAWNKGKTLSAAHKASLSASHKKNPQPYWLGKKRPNMTGENHPQWISDRDTLQRYGDERKDRRSSAYNAWRKAVWLRDNFACKIANPDCVGRIEAHHILGWKEHPELRYEVNNGITLCHFHHPRKRNDEMRLSPYFKELINANHF